MDVMQEVVLLPQKKMICHNAQLFTIRGTWESMMKLYGHTKRMNDNRMVKSICEWSEWKKWVDYVKDGSVMREKFRDAGPGVTVEQDCVWQECWVRFVLDALPREEPKPWLDATALSSLLAWRASSTEFRLMVRCGPNSLLSFFGADAGLPKIWECGEIVVLAGDRVSLEFTLEP